MAEETIGKTYEALLYIALKHLSVRHVFSGKVFWNATPAQLVVEPDFVIGETKDSPNCVILVTHSTASVKSEIKTWRNIGELAEIKTSLGPHTKVLNFYFDAKLKASLKQLQTKAFDYFFCVDDKPYGLELISWVKAKYMTLSVEKDDKASEIEVLIRRNPALQRAMDAFECDLKHCFLINTSPFSSLWELEKKRTPRTSPTARETYVRRGLSKFLIFENRQLGLDFYHGKAIPQKSIPLYIFKTGLAKKTVAGAIPSDNEVLSAVTLLDEKTVLRVCKSIDGNAVVDGYLEQIRNVSSVSDMLNYVINNYTSLVDYKELTHRLIELHNNKFALIKKEDFPTFVAPFTVWLFNTLLELIKADTGKANGYGCAKLTSEVVSSKELKMLFGKETTDFLDSPWGYLYDWSCRTDHQDIPQNVIACVAYILSKHLNRIGLNAIKKHSSNFVSLYLKNLIEAKLCTYNKFSPLPELITTAMGGVHKVFFPSFKSCFAESAGLSGRTGTSTVMVIGRNLINWQTATDSGKDHKRKELCGRAVGLRYTWDQKTESFKKRPGVNRLILLLDGTWSQKDLDALVRAGWDEIYYPDEIDKLKASVLGSVTTKTPEHPTEEEADFPEAAEKTKPYGRTKARKL